MRGALKWAAGALMIMMVIGITCITPLAASAPSAGDLTIKHRPPFLSAIAGQDIDVEALAPTSCVVVLQYRQHAQTTYSTVAAREHDSGRYFAVIPAEATAAPGVWYRFLTSTSEGKVAQTPEFFIQTVDEPVVIQAVEGANIAWDIQAKGGVLPRGTAMASADTACPLPTYASVTSKLLELRNVPGGSNPHNGIDVSCANGIEVRAMQAGYVVIKASSTTAGKFVVLGHGQKLSSNPDTYQYYSHYFHLSDYEDCPEPGNPVEMGKKIGKSGDTGTPGQFHLDFGFDTGGSSALWDNGRWVLPAKYFFSGISGWNGGNDLDFAQPPRAYFSPNYGTYIDIDVYPKGSSGGTVTVILKYRLPGETTWYSANMTNVGASTVYRGYFGQEAWRKTVDYYVKIERGSVSGYVTRPAEKFAAEPSYYYAQYVSPPWYPPLRKETR